MRRGIQSRGDNSSLLTVFDSADALVPCGVFHSCCDDRDACVRWLHAPFYHFILPIWLLDVLLTVEEAEAGNTMSRKTCVRLYFIFSFTD